MIPVVETPRQGDKFLQQVVCAEEYCSLPTQSFPVLPCCGSLEVDNGVPVVIQPDLRESELKGHILDPGGMPLMICAPVIANLALLCRNILGLVISTSVRV